jgi:DNA-binding response OmpR family regulator
MTSKPILIVDDDLAILDMIADLLTYEGYNVVTATKGSAALERIMSERPALVLLDLMMPEISGWQIVAALKASSRTRSIPIILLSARRDLAETAMELGVTAYLEKPFELDELLTAIQRHAEPNATAAGEPSDDCR